CVVRSAVLFYLANYLGRFYLPVTWIAYAPQLIILIAVVLEVFGILFHPYETLPANTIGHFVMATIAVIVVAAVLTWRFPGAQPTAWMTFARALDQVVTWVLCLIFGLIVLFAKYFGIPWRHRLQGIALGFLIYLTVDVAVTTAVTQFRLPPYSAVWPFGMAAFLIACCTWTYYFAAEEAPRTAPTLDELRRIQDALRRIAGAIRDLSVADSGGAAHEPARRGFAHRFPRLELYWKRMR
ncbi:MAG: hypothetical protein ABSD20_13185, partial [Terriglobales bacterium]